MKILRLVLIIAILSIGLLPLKAENLFWQQISGSVTGDILGMAVKGNTIYAAASERGLYRSNDLGKSWEQVKLDSAMSNLFVYCVAIRNNNEIYIGTTGGVFYSDNNCTSWNYVGAGLGDPFINMIGISAAGDIFVSTLYDGLYRSTNKGTNWKDANNGLGTPSVNSIAFTDNNEIFLGAYSGIYFSRDNGSSWKQMNNGIPSGSSNIYSIGLLKKFNVLIGTSRGSIYKTTNNGGTWTPIFDLQDSSQVYSIIVKNEAEIYASVYKKGVYYSNDSGKTWNLTNDGLYNKSIVCLMLAPNKTELYAGTMGSGVFKGTGDVIQTSFAGGEFCAGSEINIPFTISIDFDSTNYFTAQISDENGSFANPVNIGKLSGNKAGVIVAKIPKDTKAGTKYRVRVVSYKPLAKGSNNGVDIVVKELPSLSVNGKFYVCPNLPFIYKTVASADIETKWSVIGGQISGDPSIDSVMIVWDDVNKGSIKLIQKHLITGCIDSTVQEVIIKLPAKPTLTLNGETIESSSETGNQWYFEGKIITGATEKTYKAIKTGKYYVVVTDSSGCKSLPSDEVYINVKSVYDPIVNKSLFEISPNPATQYLNIKVLSENSILSRVVILNLVGEKVFDSGNEEIPDKINVNAFVNGMYVIQLTINNNTYVDRFLIRR